MNYVACVLISRIIFVQFVELWWIISEKKERKRIENACHFNRNSLFQMLTLIVCPRAIYMLEGVMRHEQRQLVCRDPIATIWIMELF